jgi:DNA-binding transcriptional MerR regulator
MKRGGGRRYYRPDDVDLLRGVRHLLYGEGYTIRGVQRILRDEGTAFVQNVWREGAVLPDETDDDRIEAELPGEAADERPARSPSLFEFANPPPRERDAERNEPLIVPRPAVEPPARRGVASEVAAKLRIVLDELAECRRLIDAALADNGAGQGIGRSGEI